MTPRIYTITDKHGVEHEMTAKQAAERSGLRLGLMQKRLNRLGIRTLEKLFQSPAAAHRESARLQSLRESAHFGAEAAIRAKKAEHESVVLAGNQEVA